MLYLHTLVGSGLSETCFKQTIEVIDISVYYIIPHTHTQLMYDRCVLFRIISLLILQESYVWEMYLKQDWDFFPVGDSFNSQEEYPLSGGQQLPPRGNNRQGGKQETGQQVHPTRTSVKRAHTSVL